MLYALHPQVGMQFKAPLDAIATVLAAHTDAAKHPDTNGLLPLREYCPPLLDQRVDTYRREHGSS